MHDTDIKDLEAAMRAEDKAIYAAAAKAKKKAKARQAARQHKQSFRIYALSK